MNPNITKATSPEIIFRADSITNKLVFVICEVPRYIKYAGTKEAIPAVSITKTPQNQNFQNLAPKKLLREPKWSLNKNSIRNDA